MSALRLLTVTLALLPPLTGQEILVLADGTKAEGELRTRGEVTWLVGPIGARRVDPQAVVERSPLAPVAERYRERAAGLPPGFLAGHLALARWCREEGLGSGVLSELEAVLRAAPRNEKAHALARDLAEDWRLDPRETADRPRDHRAFVRRLFDQLPAEGRAQAAIALAKARALPADGHLFRTALDALDHPRPSVRWMAALALEPFRAEPRRIKPLFERGLLDADPMVREAAVHALAVTEDEAFVRLFAKNIEHANPAVRVHAIDALGQLGQRAAVPHLLAALADGGGPTRNNIAITTQRAYVKDFDVEVAQGAVIADPIVDVVQDGTVLDVSVVAVSIIRTRAGRALARLTGVDHGTDFAAWRAHYERMRQDGR